MVIKTRAMRRAEDEAQETKKGKERTVVTVEPARDQHQTRKTKAEKLAAVKAQWHNKKQNARRRIVPQLAQETKKEVIVEERIPSINENIPKHPLPCNADASASDLSSVSSEGGQKFDEDDEFNPMSILPRELARTRRRRPLVGFVLLAVGFALLWICLVLAFHSTQSADSAMMQSEVSFVEELPMESTESAISGFVTSVRQIFSKTLLEIALCVVVWCLSSCFAFAVDSAKGRFGTQWQVCVMVAFVVCIYRRRMAWRHLAWNRFSQNMDNFRAFALETLTKNPSREYTMDELWQIFLRRTRIKSVPGKDVLLKLIAKEFHADHRICVAGRLVGQKETVSKYQWAC